MKACLKNRKLIAWLAIDALDAPQAAALRDHLARCEGCRRYWEQMSRLTSVLASSRSEPSVEASTSFHRRLLARLHAADSSPCVAPLTRWLRDSILSWRVAVPGLIVLMSALYLTFAPRPHPVPSSPSSAPIQVLYRPSSAAELTPTLANYETIANESLDKLDEVLTRQANHGLPPVPVYTALSAEFANGAL